MNDGVGSVRKLAEGHQLTYSRRYGTTVDDLWSALTDPGRVGRWLADLQGELRPGGAHRLDFAGGSDPDQVTNGTILTCQPPRFLKLTWDFGGTGSSIVEARVTAENGGARLYLEHVLPSAQAAGYGPGWHAYLLRLRAVLDGTDLPDWDEAFAASFAEYQAVFEQAGS